MKTAWNIVAFIAIANLLGLILMIAWLGASGRVDSARVERVRKLLSEPVAVEAARVKETELKAIAQRQAAQDETSLLHLSAGSTVPIDSLEQVRRMGQMILDQQRENNARDQQSLLADMRELAAEKKALAEEKAAYEKVKADERAVVQAAGFRSVLKDLEANTRWAKEYIVLLVTEGRGGLAAQYLGAMRAGPRAEVFNQMKSEDELKLAPALHDLLRGVVPEKGPPAETSHAGVVAYPSSN